MNLYAELTDMLEAQEAQADVSAARPVTALIQSMDDNTFTPEVAAQIAAVLSARVSSCAWSHWARGQSAAQYLDDACDVLQDELA